jgi:hypothetical protein
VIELFDAARLTVKRDHTLAAAGGVLLVTASLMAAYTAFLQVQLRSTLSRTQELQGQLAALVAPAHTSAAGKSPTPQAALVVDLQRQAEQLEREAELARLPARAAGAEAADGSPTPAQWMDVLAALTQAETSLQKVEIERSGNARIEGLASSPQALNTLVQAWERQGAVSRLSPRTMEVKQEKQPAPFLRFQLRAAPVPVATTAPSRAAAQPSAAPSAMPASRAVKRPAAAEVQP